MATSRDHHVGRIVCGASSVAAPGLKPGMREILEQIQNACTHQLPCVRVFTRSDGHGELQDRLRLTAAVNRQGQRYWLARTSTGRFRNVSNGYLARAILSARRPSL